MTLLLEVAQIVAPVFLIAAIGYAWVRVLGWGYDVEFVSRLSMTLSTPCLIFMALVRSQVEPELLRDTVAAAIAAYVVVGVAVWGLLRALDLDIQTFWAPLSFGNTGNLGLPIALFAFGQLGFDMAVVIFAVMAIMSFTFGVWVVAGGGNPLNAVREPLVWGAVAGSVFLAMGWSVPPPLAGSLDLVGQMAIPLMLITLGVAISRLQPRALGRAFWLCLVKLAICTAAPLAVGFAFGLPRLALGVLVLQVSTPVAVTSYMLANKFNARPDEVAGLVVVSTLMSVVTIPATLAFFL
ncbi:AEC family transporter [Amaricoccus sp.]|uniref:AEC family transporter n=1 Tax=Amaricoccus sp. TaxID=1872485 RepID=UPI001B5E05CC|nr:AEC family transporter [Amaricoccus sp.]MBP7242624.1 AEC family transporter [Amaricoccus sp.]